MQAAELKRSVQVSSWVLILCGFAAVSSPATGSL